MLHLPVEFSKQYIYLNMVMVMNSIKMGVVWWVWCIYIYIILFSCHFNHNKGVNQLKYLDFNIDVKSEGWRSQSQVDISLFSLCWFRCGHGELQPPGTPGYSGYEPRAEWRMGPEQLRWPVVSGRALTWPVPRTSRMPLSALRSHSTFYHALGKGEIGKLISLLWVTLNFLCHGFSLVYVGCMEALRHGEC